MAPLMFESARREYESKLPLWTTLGSALERFVSENEENAGLLQVHWRIRSWASIEARMMRTHLAPQLSDVVGLRVIVPFQQVLDRGDVPVAAAG